MKDIWIVEDNRNFREAMKLVLNSSGGRMRCRKTFGFADQALQELRLSEPPNVILLDINLPGMSGIDAIPKFRTRAPGVEIIMLTIMDDYANITQALCSGASGYVLKTASPDEIRQAISEVVNGGAPMSPSIARSVLNLFSRYVPMRKDYGLTDREREVLELMVAGCVKKEIADKLEISVHTVDKHARKIYLKLQVHSLSAAVAKAVRDKLF